MSIVQQFHAAVATANTLAALDNLSRLLWKAHAEACLSDDAAQAAAEAVEARKAALKGPRPSPASERAYAAPRPPSRSPDRQRSLERRRRCAASGAIPAKLAASFTQGETAVLSIIAGEVKRRGRCDLPIDAIAAMAGCSRTVVQSALRQARSIGLVHVQERPQPGRKHLTNVVTIISPDWRAWLRLENDRVKFPERHEYQNNKHSKKAWASAGATWRSRSVRASLPQNTLEVRHV